MDRPLLSEAPLETELELWAHQGWIPEDWKGEHYVKAKILIDECQARNQAIHTLDAAIHKRTARISDPCVLAELRTIAEERGVEIEFYGYADTGERIVLTNGEIRASLEGVFEARARETKQRELS